MFTYGGINIGFNEVSSLGTVKAMETPLLKPSYQWLQDKIASAPGLNRIGYFTSGRFLMVCSILVGGMLALVPTKWMEDSKGSKVRALDRHVFGIKDEDDPAAAELHKEMDRAPKQSWRSLLEGRVTVILAAFGMDISLGMPNAISSKLFENTLLKHYSTADRASASIARNVMDFFDPQGKGVRLAARSAEQPYAIQPGEGGKVKWTAFSLYLLTISVSLTCLFYVSSKFFAKNIAKKEDRKEAVARGEIPPDKEVTVDEKSVDAAKPLAQADAQPKTQVSDVERSGQRAKPAASKAVTA